MVEAEAEGACSTEVTLEMLIGLEMERIALSNDPTIYALTPTSKFYTYAWLREDGTPYYIGKGCGPRAWVKHRNWDPPSRDRVLILKRNLTNEEAIRHEIYMIAVLGRKFEGGILNNLTAGGEGGTLPSPSTRKKMSEWQKGVAKP